MYQNFISLLLLIVLFVTYNTTLSAYPIKSRYSEMQYRFKHINNQEGLKYSWIWNINQDRKGYLWFSTMYGTYRYDGYEFEEYTFKDRQKGTAVNVLFVVEDVFGELWFGTNDGLYRHNPNYNTYEHYSSSKESTLRLSTNDIISLSESKDGALWVGTANGLNVIDRDRKKCKVVKFLNHDFSAVTAIAQLSNNVICIGNNKGEIWYIKDRNICTKVEIEGITESILDIFQDNSKAIWIASEGSGLIKIDEVGNIKYYTENDGTLSNNIVRSICQNSDGSIWAATECGITIFRGKEIDFLYRRDNDTWALNDNAIYSLYCDRDGAMWIGTFFGGINMTNPRYEMFSDLLTASGENILKNAAISFISSDDNNIYIGTENKGFFIYDNLTGKIKNYQDFNSGLSNNNVHAIYIDDKKNIWIGNFYGGLNCLSPHTNKIKTYFNKAEDRNTIPSNSVYSILQDRDGILWIGTRYGGLCSYDYETDTFNPFEKLPSQLFIWDMIEDYQGDIWLACYGEGIYKLDRKRDFEPILIATNAKNYINLCELSDGRILASSEKEGLTEIGIHDLSVVQHTSDNGLPDNTIYGVVQDHLGNIWFSSNSGIYMSGTQLDRFNNFTVTDGLPTNRFNYNACARIGERVWFGSINGIVAIDPTIEGLTIKKHPIRFKNIYIYNEKQTISRQKGSILTMDLNLIKELVLHSNRLSWKVDFSTNVFDNKTIYYAFQLENIDDTWHNLETQNSVSLTGLSFGKYSLTVAVLDSDGSPSDNRCTLNIRITPPWWRSKTAIICYALIVLGILAYLIWLLFSNTRNKLAFKLEYLAREKDKEVNEIKLNSFINISHEFKTPLSLIVGPINALLEGNIPKRVEERYFNIIKTNVDKLLDLINELLAFRELEHLKLQIKPFHYRPLIDSVLSRYSWLFEGKNIHIEIEDFDPELVMWADIDKLEKILNNMLSNVYKFTPMNGTCRIRVEQSEYNIRTTITNSGPGIPPEKSEHIFERYFTADTHGRYSSGVGLSYVKSLINMHNGDITVFSVENEYTCFSFTLPVDINEKEIPLVDLKRYNLETFEELELPFVSNAKFNNKEYLLIEQQTKVLVVEDDTVLRNLLVEILDHNFETSGVSSASDALKVVSEKHVDIVITDVMLNEKINGFKLCKMLKDNMETSHIRVVLITVLSENNYKKHAYNIGADAYIVKPFEFSLLAMRIRNLVYTAWKARENYKLDIDLSNINITNSNSDEELIKRAVAIVFDNISEPEFNVDDLCRMLGMSQSSFYRKLKTMTGQSVNEFIQNIRLKYAARLLRETTKTISEIAFDVGFSDSSYFSRAFRKCFRVSPKAWRENNL